MLIQQLLNSNKYDVKCPYEMTPVGICIHNTANDAPAKNEISYMSNNTNEVSFHIAIDNIESIQAIPFNRNSWHAGDGGSGPGNRSYIAIEICYSKSGGERFVNAEKRAAKEVSELLKQFGWGIDKVKKHQDFSNKYCPHRTLDIGWNRFINMIQSELNGSSTPSASATSDLYRVRKSWGDAATQMGAYSNLENAKKECNKNLLYSVFNSNGIKVYPIATVAHKPLVANKNFLNLHPHNASWRIYPIGSPATVGNECGRLAPATYGGLSYSILEDRGDIKIIETEYWGKVQIYAPRDNDSSITTSPMY